MAVHHTEFKEAKNGHDSSKVPINPFLLRKKLMQMNVILIILTLANYLILENIGNQMNDQLPDSTYFLKLFKIACHPIF